MKWWRRPLRPLGSAKMREISRHMTVAEHLKASMYGIAWGLWAGHTVLIPVGFFVWSVTIPYEPPGRMLPLLLGIIRVHAPTWPTALGILVAALAINIPLVIYLRRKLKKFLAGTKWARSQGYTVDDL